MPNRPAKSPRTEKEHFINESFQIAKDLIYSLPIVPRYDLISQLAQDIERGDFDDLGGFSENRQGYLDRAKTILRLRNIIIS
ncbi:gp18 [Bacillus phage G]|uniref:Gp18 n=1 Tax=Bacillus phage G TaxID=2884420 RepID=G3MB88_9CAUD|nr:gp18 [Bacillus phage G]AEO93289.1 gp18 [Bacillus phage G]